MAANKPPFTAETARQKVKAAQDLWNTQDPARIALAYTPDSVWRNRSTFLRGQDAIKTFLSAKWAKEQDYVLRKELFAFTDNRIAVQFWYEYRDAHDVLTREDIIEAAKAAVGAGFATSGAGTLPTVSGTGGPESSESRESREIDLAAALDSFITLHLPQIGQGKWKRCYGLEDWTFAPDGRMRKRQMSGNDVLLGMGLGGDERWFGAGVKGVEDVVIGEEHW
ncbi:DUF1348-domain-containing protein [Xylona heveae TC161]|uniref:DUF1348-domain-containing protein n=1 Tax=Xylona heveae (strain CBS 132557 / TC161) TaxID=1328760 RepID=A0A165FEX7_XYLHT|nr:DUF1348-domain-containing protein [Xylona heveae TC161]KZF20898.1 DUF1348-domain-containing protein [Xylona heveae TC161]